MSRPRVLLYTEEFLSPSMTFIARQIDAIQSRFEVSVLARTRRNAELFPFEPVNIVPAHASERLSARLRRHFHGRDWKIAGSARKAFNNAIARRKPDLIHAHFGPSGLAILPFAREQGIPLVTTFHGFDASSYLARGTYRRDLAELFDYGQTVTVSEEMRRSLIALGADPARTHCRYNGVPLDSFSVPKRRSIAEKRFRGEAIRFLQVSNFVEKKGHEFTVRAFFELINEFPNCELTLVGSGPLVPQTKRLVEELGLGKRVSFFSHKSSSAVATLMRDADCFVHHSVTGADGDKEGIPTVLMEAMATGLPVISTRHSGIPELLDHGVDGLLVGERDLASYVEAMKCVLDDYGEIGARARAKVESVFNLNVCSLGLCDLYDVILRGKDPVWSSGLGKALS